MKRSLTTIGLLSATLLAAAPGMANAFQTERMPVQFGQAEPGGEPERGPESMGQLGLDIAAKLSAAETYVGITTAQEDAWRAYTSALIAFFEHPAPIGGEHGPGRDGPPPALGTEQAKPAAPSPAPLFAERVADSAIEQGEKARTLKAAAGSLRATLSGDQLVRLIEAEIAFAPPHGDPEGRPGDWRDHGRPYMPFDMSPPPPTDE
ncbi:hypothetical protein [Mesorhizobium australicum]|uniref:LTXXQ motif family protein n=1 Tax=Mesorhizobium australicum TaxID=536018 RepID=A0A1X7NHD5_9HYPH|nr:hypothetical protein [Mesorhizobium australicum]SMH37231.1 hypothetical protein SAMN02982922_1880 [Mesorhizobium australicum]